MDYYAKPEVMVFVFLAVGAIALYSYLSINSYVNGRRKEREAYYKNETVRRLTESAGAGADAAIALLREEDRLQTTPPAGRHQARRADHHGGGNRPHDLSRHRK